ncbi:MAG: DNA-binding protein [Flavobacteriaceae bacterium]|nr:DNA-binding protein [Flavobacteriaceae bacterium]|tara:strand:+ start:9500 stop:10981 length:1482 start_codon:yes stop_codon:yes gene_type:complete
MLLEDEYIRLIFGLKLKQIRTEKNLSLFGLSKLSGLSKSYLNEIEKGKKYPKTDKILILAEKLETPYDHLVSLKLDKNLAPIGDILQSKILKEIPLDLFGIRENNLIDIIANAPAKVNAFISTIIKIATNYNLTRERFFLASLRSYQEAHNNYFKELEVEAEKFTKAYQIGLKNINAGFFEEILIEEYGYTINEDELNKHANLEELRNIFIPAKKTLLIDKNVSEAQKTFIYAKELAYNFLNIEDRLYTFPWIKFESFDQVLNNFKASYFAGALIIPQKDIVGKLEELFGSEEWNPMKLHRMIKSYNCSQETFYQRLTNILTEHFNIKNLFFLRFNKPMNSEEFKLTKELHITQQQAPHANRSNDHYCRRWISLKTIHDLEQSKKDRPTFGIQISSYENEKSEYLVLSSASQDPFKKDVNRSISIGLLLSPHLKRKLKFLKTDTFDRKIVGVTCETCSVQNCKERVAPPVKVERVNRHQHIENTVEKIIKSFS